MERDRDACRCCGRPLEEEGAARPGVCNACAATRALSPPPPGIPPRDPEGIPGGSRRMPDLPGPGTELGGGLVVEGRLGRGGMGLVLAARDPELDRRVAVKFLREDLVGNPRAERFFRREGRALAGLSHPGVVRVFSVGSHEGWPFLVMELVEGTTLARRIREGPIPLDEGLRLAEELAGALGAVHASGLVHRDVNPANVVLRRGDGTACLIDFGLARQVARSTRTTGAVAGTPLYMAPEQVARQEQDQRVDVYSYGATLFEVVTGRVPHPDPDQSSFFRTVLHEDAPLLRTIRPDAPRTLEILLARALSRPPELRQADGRALLEEVRAVRRDLAAAAGGEGLVAEGPPETEDDTGPPPRDPSETFPLVGRDEEYAAAASLLDRLEERRGRVLLLEGEAGAGKSRLLRELERAARSRAQGVIRCTGGEFSGNPFRALREALLDYGRGLGARAPGDLVAFTLRAAPHNGPLAPSLGWFLDPGPHEEESRPARSDLARAVLALLRAILAVRPVLLVAEDAHLLDAGSLDLLVAAAEEGTSWPLALAFSYRPSDASEPRAPLAAILPRLRGVPGAAPIRLGPLPEAAVATLIHLGLGLDEAEACRLAPLLHRKSSGNPLYVVEALKLLEQEREGGGETGKRRTRQRITSMAIPPRLMEIAVRRISGLPPAERDTLGVASVDPEGVTADLVARCLDVSRLQALRVLQQLVAGRGLLRQRGDTYWITHGEIRDAIYGELIPELRAAYHAEAARALEEAGAAGTDPARLGRHLRQAGSPREAAPHLLEAGRRMLLGHSPSEALEFFEEAEGCAGEGGSPAAAVGRAQSLELLGELDAARGILVGLMAAGGGAAAEALLPLAEFERNRGRYREMLEMLEGADAGALPPERRMRLLILEAQALSQLELGDHALRVLEEAEGLAATAPPLRLLELRGTQGTVRWRLGIPEEAARRFEEALDLAERLGAMDRSAAMLYNLALTASDVGNEELALSWVERAVERALLAGNPRTLVHSRLLMAEILLEALRPAEAKEPLDLAEGDLEGLESTDAKILQAACRAELALQEGRTGDSLSWSDEALALAADSPRKQAEIRLQRARVRFARKEPEAALAELRRIPGGTPASAPPSLAEEALALAARALRETGGEGPERERLRESVPAHSSVAAVERALEEPDAKDRERWVDLARGLAHNERDRAYIAERL